MNRLVPLFAAILAACPVVPKPIDIIVEPQAETICIAPRLVSEAVLSEELKEISGVVESESLPGMFWAINDSGNSPTLFLLDDQGEIVDRKELPVPNVDFEDLAYENGRVYIGDIGDNAASREHITIHRYDELTEEITSFDLAYQNGPRDAESLTVVGGVARIYTKIELSLDGEAVSDPKTEYYEARLGTDTLLYYRGDLRFPDTETDRISIGPFGVNLKQPLITAADVDRQGRRLIRSYSKVYFEDGCSHRILTPGLGESIAWYGEGFVTAAELEGAYDVTPKLWQVWEL